MVGLLIAASAGACLRIPAIADRRRLGQPVARGGVVEERHASIAPRGEVDVEPRPALVVEGLGHERGELALLARQLLHRILEAEGTVRSIEGVAVPEVDLELAAGELVVGRHYLHAVAGEMTEVAQQDVLGVALEPGDIDVARRLPVALPAGGRALVTLQHVELELRPDHRTHAEVGELGHDLLEHVARALHRLRAVRVEQVGDVVRDTRFPRHGLPRREVGNATTSGSPADAPPSMSTTSPIGVVP